MSTENPTAAFPPIAPKLIGFLCPWCFMEIKSSDDIQNYTLPAPAAGVGIMFVAHKVCHKPIPFLIVPLPPGHGGSEN